MAKKLFKEGNPGRKKGSKNKITKTVKDTFLNVFLDLQSDPKNNLKAFATKNPRDFYNLSTKLIPTEVTANLNTHIIQVKVPGEKESEE